MADKIYDANDRALEERILLGYPYTDHRSRILFHSTRLGCQWTGQVDEESDPVTAFIDAGRWVAHCECGNLEYVTPADPIFFCHGCGNLLLTRAARPVIFPDDDDRKAIEQALLARPVIDGAGLTPIDRARGAVPDIEGLDCCWDESISVAAVQAANAAEIPIKPPEEKLP